MASHADFAAAGVSTRRVEYWTRQSYLRADDTYPGSGRPRHWPDSELRVAIAMARLADAGLSLDAAHTVARGEPQLAPGVRVLLEDVPAQPIPSTTISDEWTEAQSNDVKRCAGCGKTKRLRLEPYTSTYRCKPCWEAVVYGAEGLA